MSLVDRDLSEPYSIFTYRYFLHNWPDLCFVVSTNFWLTPLCFTVNKWDNLSGRGPSPRISGTYSSYLGLAGV